MHYPKDSHLVVTERRLCSLFAKLETRDRENITKLMELTLLAD